MNTSKNRIEGLSDWRVAADVVLREKEIWLGRSAALSWTRRGQAVRRWRLCSFVLTVRLLKLFQLKIKIL
jgi:hypothetical protein